MSKFLYPIYKLKTKSYIKWWLYHKKAGGSGVLSEILEGFSFNLENTLNRKFKLFEIEGNSVQDGSPSPETQVPILSSGDNENIIDIQPFNITGGTTSYNGRNFTVNLPAGTYTLQRKYTKSSNAPNSAGMVQLKRNNVYYKNLDAGVASTIVELTEDTELKLEFYLSTSITSAEESSIDFYDIKLEKSNKASGYSPYGMGSINEKIKNADGTEEQDYSIFVQQPFRSIGDVRDCFVKKDGSWYERHYIGEVVLNGSRAWNKSATYSNETYFCGYLNTAVTNIIDESLTLNNSFQIGMYSSVLDKECMSNNVQLQVRILASRLTENSANGFKQWLSTHNVKAYGRYVTPLDLPCTTEQVEQLENLPSTYKDFTIIQSEDETPAYLKIQYYKEG